MPKHLCIDPHDPYAQHEVLVEFERDGSGLRLVAVIDGYDDDILGDLVEAQREDLRREIADADCPLADPIPMPPNHGTTSSLAPR
ncbi:hypothetical protein FV226_11205 [Methylobacterium sp. WL12]|uniref:hypothetical protein n=1 Tax=Methylobacterium sp. WL12 TaxID=2603890 RepID=UPI0011C97E28|nr:hypothetical protein [Methylobacterium sp. WL12]TXM72744.1 hypothetical protein FV226_11205 [Methylobacterium sp. WL12]